MADYPALSYVPDRRYRIATDKLGNVCGLPVVRNADNGQSGITRRSIQTYLARTGTNSTLPRTVLVLIVVTRF